MKKMKFFSFNFSRNFWGVGNWKTKKFWKILKTIWFDKIFLEGQICKSDCLNLWNNFFIISWKVKKIIELNFRPLIPDIGVQNLGEGLGKIKSLRNTMLSFSSLKHWVNFWFLTWWLEANKLKLRNWEKTERILIAWKILNWYEIMKRLILKTVIIYWDIDGRKFQMLRVSWLFKKVGIFAEYHSWILRKYISWKMIFKKF